MKKIFDISLTLSNDLPVWPGDPAINLSLASSIKQGADANVTFIRMGAHTGTHLDAPCHFIDEARSVEDLSLDVLIGPVQVIELPDSVDLITRQVLEATSIESERVIFKTKNTSFWKDKGSEFQKEFVAISGDGAEYLAELGIKLVGVDYLSVAPFDDGIMPHRALLGRNVIPLEGLYLEEVQAGFYELICLPLKIKGSDGAPARVVLIQNADQK
jgi:arylformamidase